MTIFTTSQSGSDAGYSKTKSSMSGNGSGDNSANVTALTAALEAGCVLFVNTTKFSTASVLRARLKQMVDELIGQGLAP